MLRDVDWLRAIWPNHVRLFAGREADYVLELYGTQVPANTYSCIQRNASDTRDFRRVIPKPLVVVVMIAGQPARALLDSGSLADFMSGATSRTRFSIESQSRRKGSKNYDVILGTPFLFQHNILLGLNPARVVVGNTSPVPIRGDGVRVLSSRAADVTYFFGWEGGPAPPISRYQPRHPTKG